MREPQPSCFAPLAHQACFPPPCLHPVHRPTRPAQVRTVSTSHLIPKSKAWGEGRGHDPGEMKVYVKPWVLPDKCPSVSQVLWWLAVGQLSLWALEELGLFLHSLLLPGLIQAGERSGKGSSIPSGVGIYRH